MENPIVANALDFVKKTFESDFSGHDYFHTLRVFKTASRIAAEENADLLTVQLAALLHDVDDIKLSPETHESKANAVQFLRANHVEEDFIRTICCIIDEISFSGNGSTVPQTLEGKCVQDADRLDAIGAIGIARTFAYGGSHHRPIHDPAIPPKLNMTKEEYRNHKATSINHFYEKLFLLKDLMNTPSAKQIALRRESFMHSFMKQFMEEWDGVR